jgi:hypothetical protein
MALLPRWFHRSPPIGAARARRQRRFRTEMELLEGRALLSTMSAVSWVDSQTGLPHHEVFAINSNDNVEISEDGSTFIVDFAFQAEQVSAGLDASGNPEVFALGLDNSVYVSHGMSAFVHVGGYVREISASVKNTVYAIGFNDAVYVNYAAGTPWVDLYGVAKQISAGADASGNPEVFVINQNNALFVNRGSGYIALGSGVKQISGTMKDTVFAINQNNTVSEYVGSKSPVNLGGAVTQISAGLDAYGNPQVFAIDQYNNLVVSPGAGFVSLGEHASEVSAPSLGVALSGDLAYFAGPGHKGYLRQGPAGQHIDLKGLIE